MKRSTLLLIFSVFPASFLFAQDDFYSFRAAVRSNVSDVMPVEVAVSLGSVKVIDVGNDLVLEFTSPGSSAEGEMSMVRLLRKTGDEFKVLHTARQGFFDGKPRQNGYLVCGERVTFISPAPASLPECNI